MSPVIGIVAIDIVVFTIVAIMYSFTGSIKPALLYTNKIVIYSYLAFFLMLCCLAMYNDYIKEHEKKL